MSRGGLLLGSKRFTYELIFYSGQFALFYIIMQVAKVRALFVSHTAHMVLLAALILQSLFLARFGDRILFRITGTFIVPLLYSAIETTEGVSSMFNAAHVGFWLYAVAACLLQVWNIENAKKHRSSKSIELLIVVMTIFIYVFLYFYFDTAENASSSDDLTIFAISRHLGPFLQDPTHLYIVFAGVVLAVILGLGRIEIVVLKDRITRLFGQYIDESVRDAILSDGATGAKKEELCVMFSDIRNFTKLNEENDPDQVTRMLNLYFEQWSAVVKKHGGIIDKFIGDAVMAIFGYDHDPRAVDSAVSCGLEMLSLWDESALAFRRLGLPVPEGFGIGCHFGSVVIGSMGSEERRTFTVIGDTVNIASRLEAATKTIESDFLISASLRERLSPGLRESFDRIGVVKLRGKEKGIEVWGRKKEERPRQPSA